MKKDSLSKSKKKNYTGMDYPGYADIFFAGIAERNR